jgi:FlaA1/EpsC-like NDP-sugar epimerase
VIAEVAVEYGRGALRARFDDKAANPKNLLGQSKALCEWIVEGYGHRDEISTRFVAVRFGNVLNSVRERHPDLPPQIEKGGR